MKNPFKRNVIDEYENGEFDEPETGTKFIEYMTKEQFIDFLNWMIACNIITYEEYNKLQLNALPFLK